MPISRPIQPSGILLLGAVESLALASNLSAMMRVGGKVDPDAFGFGLCEQFFCRLQAIVFAEGVADLAAGCFEKGIGHPAADDDIGRAFEEVFDDEDLVGDFGAADDGGERLLRLMQDLFGAGDLAFHEQAEHPFVFWEELGDDGGGGVGAVGGAEGVIDIDVAEFCQLFGEILVAFFLLFVKPEVFQQHDLAGLRLCDGLFRR